MDGISEEVSKMRDVLSSSGVQLFAEIGAIALPDEDKNILCFVMREAVTNVCAMQRQRSVIFGLLVGHGCADD